MQVILTREGQGVETIAMPATDVSMLGGPE